FVSFTMSVPAMGKIARPFALEQIAHIEKSVSALEQDKAKQDWELMQVQADEADHAMNLLMNAAPVLPALALINQQTTTLNQQTTTLDELRAQVKAANGDLQEVQQAVRAKDRERLETALKKFHK